MDMLKRVLAVLGVAFGSLALSYLVFAWSFTLKNFGLSVEDWFKENGITCDMGNLGKMSTGLKETICANPLKMGVWGLSPGNGGEYPQRLETGFSWCVAILSVGVI